MKKYCISATILLAATLLAQAENLRSKDASIAREGSDWVLATSQVEKRIRLVDGHLVSTALRNKNPSRDYQSSASPSPEMSFTLDGRNTSDDRWDLKEDHTSRGLQGELQLDISLISANVHATKHYVVYPETSVVREWLTLENSSHQPIRITHLNFLTTRLATEAETEFNYVTGGGNYNGSQLLKSEPMGVTYKHTIDSNGGVQPSAYSGYLPLMFLLDRSASQGVAIGWDYMGHWEFNIRKSANTVEMSLELAGFEKDLPPGKQIETPKAFIKPFSGGIDELGNQMLDWQYAYLWDYTNPDYFAKTRWAVDWPDPWVGEGGTPSADNWGRRLALDLRYVDLLRETGTDILWDDAGWYDKWGTWTAPDWRLTNDYVRKHDMRWVLWYPTFLATPESRVVQQHPDWLIPGQETLEQAIPATADWQRRVLDDSVSAWGEYQWRYDIAPAASANDTDALAADQNFRSVLEGFKRAHPQSGIDACDGGGRWISYDIARFAESGEYTDGGVGPYSAYYTSLIVSPDKLHNVVDYDHTYYVPSTDRTHLSLNPTWYRDPGDGPDVESIRKDWELYHYLVSQGVAGRWSHVFRPKVEHDDPIWYFQRMNHDGSKGTILTKHEKHGSTYYVTSRLSKTLNGAPDHYRGDAGAMSEVTTTSAGSIANGLYEDSVDGALRFYGIPGQPFGPLNVKYQAAGRDESLVTGVTKLGANRPVTDRSFGMALQVDHPMTITELGQFDTGNNRGIYTLSLVRAEDNAVLATANLDMSQTTSDGLGFKYAHLPQPVRLEANSKPIVIFPRGLAADKTYDVRAIHSKVQIQRSGSDLMAKGITLDKIEPGELIFLNLPHFPGSGTDHVAPPAPSRVTKRLGTNLGITGVEVSWSASRDDNWLSYYSIRKNGRLIAKAAIGTFFFDHSDSARGDIDAKYEVAAVDGDGNRSSWVPAQKEGSALNVYEALGDFAPTQSAQGWTYEEAVDDGTYRELTWDKGGYEGRWTGSGLGRIGRIWMQPSAQRDLSRTFVSPASGAVSTSGEIRKDPSAENHASAFVRILRNTEQVWPSGGWAEVLPDYNTPTSYKLTDLKVKAGDKLRFEVKRNGENRADPIVWNPRVVIHMATP
ncbi:MAG TPA: hypothetical protein VH088_20560 [Terriglobales bacterium]|jgi:hypothetical protein|nr:hypothetical protein [Terriglobales bacterium]